MKLAVRAAVGLIRLYQATFSRLLPSVCRFRPSCSQYACQALETWGFWRGMSLAIRRVGRCHPFHPGGEDPVPRPPTAENAPAHTAQDEGCSRDQ